jgi:hypothetical protein
MVLHGKLPEMAVFAGFGSIIALVPGGQRLIGHGRCDGLRLLSVLLKFP